ncbi:MAG TPA: alkaline phosphatase family protein [Polyangia bacterium]|jgi:arylsulfatase A-like enzyme|nr:alkaline phosphatase family protein [Polyangia bacterium]
MKLRAAACLFAIAAAGGPAEARSRPRNVVIFVADGLRPGSLNPTDAPTLVRLQNEGVFFVNSHSLFPTVTTANASAIATGHQLGDTGDFANTLYTGATIANSGTPFIEDDEVLAALDAQTGGNYLGETSLLAVARAHGFSTAAVGKLGPTLVQDVGEGSAASPSATIFIDDRTGSGRGLPLDPTIAAVMKTALGGTALPPRTNGRPQTPDDNGYSGDRHNPGTRVANVRQQQFLADAVTKVILPEFKKRGKPFVLIFWSRDPDATQHNQGDSLGELSPGINGPTSRAAVHNADQTLRQILAALESDPALAPITDLFVTSDHGFSTVSRREVDADGRRSASGSTKAHLPDVRAGDLPPGFVAIDVAGHLGLRLCDPDQARVGAGGVKELAQIEVGGHPSLGNGLIARDCALATPRQAKVVVAANGGSDLIYVPDGDRAAIADVAAFLLRQDYVDGVFVDGAQNAVPGALSLRDINLVGRALLPRPSIVVALKTFSLDPRDALRTQVDVSDTTLQQGQGTHGSFGRADVTNTMIAFGPDFKRGFVDRAPAGNADIAQTLARILGLEMPSRGRLAGRVLGEALAGGPATVRSTCGQAASLPTREGIRTLLHFQIASGVRYLDAARKLTGPIVWGDWVAALPCGGAKQGSEAAKP